VAGPVNEAAVALLLFLRAFAAPSRRADVVNTLEIEARCLAPKEATR